LSSVSLIARFAGLPRSALLETFVFRVAHRDTSQNSPLRVIATLKMILATQ
jgi:hypothetical protein